MKYAHPSTLTISQIQRGIERAQSGLRSAAHSGRWADQRRHEYRIYRLERELDRR